MENYTSFIVVLVLQYFYIIIKFVGIRHIVGGNLYSRMLITSMASVLWLLATTVSVAEMISHNYYIIIVYVIGNMLGVLTENILRKYL